MAASGQYAASESQFCHFRMEEGILKLQLISRDPSKKNLFIASPVGHCKYLDPRIKAETEGDPISPVSRSTISSPRLHSLSSPERPHRNPVIQNPLTTAPCAASTMIYVIHLVNKKSETDRWDLLNKRFTKQQ
jgi:hypothetical protein